MEDKKPRKQRWVNLPFRGVKRGVFFVKKMIEKSKEVMKYRNKMRRERNDKI